MSEMLRDAIQDCLRDAAAAGVVPARGSLVEAVRAKNEQSNRFMMAWLDRLCPTMLPEELLHPWPDDSAGDPHA